MKKIFVTGLIVTSLLTSSMGVSFAATLDLQQNVTTNSTKIEQQPAQKILVDDETQRIVEYKDKKSSVIATFNKQTQVLTISENGVKKTWNLGEGAEKHVTRLNEYYSTTKQQKNIQSIIGTRVISSNYDGWWGYSYRDTAPYDYSKFTWEISTDEYSKTVIESSTNQSNLLAFAKDVDTMDSLEWDVYVAVGAGVTASIIAFLTSPPALSLIITGLSAIGVSLTVAYKCYNIYTTSLDADRLYARIGS